MGNTSSYLSKILRVLQATDGDIEGILDELWEEAYKAGHEEGYDQGFKEGEVNVS